MLKPPVGMTLLKEIKTDEPVYSFDILYIKNLLFWHSRISTFIMKTSLDGSTNYTHMRFAFTGDPYTYLAVDWLVRNIFWSTKTSQTISVSNGKLSKIIYHQDVDKPQFLQLDVMTG